MIVQLAYHPSTMPLCRTCYERPPENFPPLGPVVDSRDWVPCKACEEARDIREIMDEADS